MPAFNPKRLRVERFNVEWAYHATYTWYGLRGVIAERWAHGPLFGAVAELGSGQLNLTPPSDEPDAEQLLAVAGSRGSAMLGEGKKRAAQAAETWPSWFQDIASVLKPLRSVAVTAELLGLYPIHDEWKTTQRLKQRYYQPNALDELAGSSRFHAGPEIFDTSGGRRRTIQMGVLGPPHRGQYFRAQSPERDTRWWLALRIHYALIDEDGIDEPLTALDDLTATVTADWQRVGTRLFPDLVA